MNFCYFRNRHISLLCILIFVLIIFQIRPAGSRIYIDIHSALQEKIPIAVPAFRNESGDIANQPLANNMADILSNALSFSGIFQVLNPAVFLQDPDKMGIEKEEIKFSEWKFLGADLLVRGSYRIQGERFEVKINLFDVIHQKLLLSRSYINSVASARDTILRFADELMLELTGELGIFHTQIAFVGDATGKKEVYLADFDGSNIRQLTNNGSMNLSPSWSADGKQIAYVGYKRGNPDIYTVDLTSKKIERISMRPGLNIAPAYHPNGGKLAATLSFTGNPELYLLDTRGQILKQLTLSWAIDVSSSWSPDGSKLAYVSNRAGKPQIYVLDVNKETTTRLTFEGDYNTSPAWSPRGDRILYTGINDGKFNIFMISPDGRELSQLTGGEGNNEDPCWSPDGRLILFQSDRQGTPTLWVMRANGSDQRRLRLGLGGSHTEADWSPRLTRMVP
ncbi:MAG: Tol-Pal system beta propeller repeat protein TolB [Deltaproteobacteria bacterium]|nr:Tol-Pal system beta propeller repeat protein TolB [Deltaproteobacteria bacterium]